MTDVAQTSRTTDRELADEMIAHHAVMVEELDRLTSDLLAATGDLATGDPDAAKRPLIDWVHEVLFPHAAEEEATTYAAAGRLAEGAALIDSLTREHGAIKELAAGFHGADSLPLAAGYARSLFLVFRSHQSKENEIVVPLLLEAPGVSLSAALADAPAGHLHHHQH